MDDQGFPDQSYNYDHLLHSIDGGPVLRKLRHLMPDLDGPIDPSFDHPFIQEEHDAIMQKKVDLSHLDLDLQNQVYDLIREFWLLFDERGVFVPKKNMSAILILAPPALLPSRRSFMANERQSSCDAASRP